MNIIKNYLRYFFSKRKLEKINPEQIERFSFNGITKFCKILSIEKNKIILLFQMNKKKQSIKLSCKIEEIDELLEKYSKKFKNKDIIKNHIKTYLESNIIDKIMFVKFKNMDSYSRTIIQLFIDISGNKNIKDNIDKYLNNCK
jgi:hypothetical protein